MAPGAIAVGPYLAVSPEWVAAACRPPPLPDAALVGVESAAACLGAWELLAEGASVSAAACRPVLVEADFVELLAVELPAGEGFPAALPVAVAAVGVLAAVAGVGVVAVAFAGWVVAVAFTLSLIHI